MAEHDRAFRLLFANNPLPMWVYDLETLRFLEVNAAAIAQYGYTREEFLAMRIADIRPLEDVPRLIEDVAKSRPDLQRSGEWRHRRKDAQVIDVSIVSHALEFEGHTAALVVAQDVTSRKQAERLLQRSEARASAIVSNALDCIIQMDQGGRILEFNPAAEATFAYRREDVLGREMAELIIPPRFRDRHRQGLAHLRETGESVILGKRLELPAMRATGEEFAMELTIVQDVSTGAPVFTGFLRDITERTRAEETMRRLAAIVESADDAIFSRTMDGVIITWNAGAERMFGYTAAEMIGRLSSLLAPPELAGEIPQMLERQHRGEEIRQFETVRMRKDGTRFSVSLTVSPVRDARGEVIGGATIVRDITHLVAARQETTRLQREAERRVAQLEALRDIDLAITGSVDLRVTLNIFLDKVTAQLGVDAACVLLADPHTQTLTYAAGRGLRSTVLRQTSLRLGEGYAGRAAMQQQPLSVLNLQSAPDGFVRRSSVEAEGIVTYHAVPLVVKGRTAGVLEVFHRTPQSPDAAWKDFLTMLAGQAAIAIDSAALFSDLQRSNVNLALAYDTTLEGWSRALDLRDKETEGHTQRVTEVAVQLARTLGMPDDHLVHLRRGALLHDIGKMGIPDSILLKPGPLTEEEWVLMHRHPEYARQLLAPIDYLRPALDIPYRHHEKWDGSGYPRGLKGEQIPLAARVFAVADVWDALRSDRPYRVAWPADEARQYVRKQAGMHFDPQVVEIFERLGL